MAGFLETPPQFTGCETNLHSLDIPDKSLILQQLWGMKDAKSGLTCLSQQRPQVVEPNLSAGMLVDWRRWLMYCGRYLALEANWLLRSGRDALLDCARRIR